MNVTPDSLDWALQHIKSYGDTDIFPVPFEYLAICHSWNSRLRDFLSKQDVFTYQARPHRRCLSPKHRLGFRISTQLDPFDTLLFTALVYEIGTDIERRRVPTHKEIVHSYRFKPSVDGACFDSDIGYVSFTAKSTTLASSGDYSFVVVADIADFFPRLYSHPLENALIACTSKPDHAKAIAKLLNQWNFGGSYGIPVGPTVSRLLSELAIADIDDALLSEGRIYCRYSDDYRLFCEDEREAYEVLAFLANVLFENHGLTLQQHKTIILPVAKFRSEYLDTPHAVERRTLSEQFEAILSALGMEDRYEPIDYDDLDKHEKKSIDALNLNGILTEQIASNADLDIPITRFVLRRLGQLDDADSIDLVLDNIFRLYPVFKDALGYVTAIRKMSSGDRHGIGRRLLDLVAESVVSHLEYHRCWIFNTFTRNREWDNEDDFSALYNQWSDEFSRRELISAMGRANQQHWFKSKKRNVFQFSPWEKRAFLAAASCLPGDEAKHWYRSIYHKLDELEKAVVDWAKANPYV